MVISEELMGKLTTSLSGDIDTYNEVINIFQEQETAQSTLSNELNEVKAKLDESEARGQNYLTQISNLLSKIPIGENKSTASYEQKLEEIKNRKWGK